MNPWEGRIPKIPQLLAGTLADPPVSVPIAKSTRPHATADADPLDDPPGTRSGDFGFNGVPWKKFSPSRLKASSSVTVLPIHCPPAYRSCSMHTAFATATGCESRQEGLPHDVLK